MASLLATTAGRYPVFFRLRGASVEANVTTSQTFTVGKSISIKSFKASRKSYGLYLSGTAAKSTPVKLSIKFGSKTYTKTVKGSSHSGYLSYKFKKTSKGTYTMSAQVTANKKYFSERATTTCRR